MSYEPLHHKYRPQTFADLVGQEAIATTLSNAMRLRRIAPAYLLTGPRGTGKTSSARILAKSLNCIRTDVPTPEPCGVCEVCESIARGNALDVIEIDAASNTGVDNIRELIERAQFAPVQCRYKIYCLDEVHMLSTAAFNALLKTLEEPPDRVVFILATTDPQRVLPTIISRCQRFDFRRIPLQSAIEHLTYIAQQENIAIAPTAIELVAQISQGGMRDAESLLDQLSLLAGEITVDRIWDLVGSVPERDLLALAEAIATANPEIILERTRHLLDRGREPLTVLQNLTGFYRDLLIAKTAPQRRDLVALTAETWEAICRFAQTVDLNTILAGQQHLRTCEIQIKNTTQPRLWLEVTLLGLIPFAAPQAAPSLTPPTGFQPAAVALPSPPVPQQIPQANGVQSPTLTPEVAVGEAIASTSAGVRSEVEAIAPPILDDDVWPTDIAAPEGDRPMAKPPLASASESAPKAAASPPAIYAQTPPPVQPPVQPQAAEVSELNLVQLWQQLLSHLNRPSRALLSEHGQLISFRGREAQIGIRNGSLARIAQSKLPDVEAAFLKLFDRKVVVSLHVTTAEVSTAPVPPNPANRTPPVLPEQKFPASVATRAPMQVASAESPPLAPAPPVETFTPPPVEVSPVAAPVWETFDALTHAARDFAQFFNGALVNLEGTPEVEMTAPLALEEKIDSPEWDEP
ncbi:DNA polymerase III subunit gamma/tau [Altericista sp. CCNU0014]|uniref:DNA polymerase III subunit gamma/tau n=1 Tax=Altericista sp. CCNU0014 TaxID=3082949 RepID=UPI00384E6498